MGLDDSGLRVCQHYPSVIGRSDLIFTNRKRNGEVVITSYSVSPYLPITFLSQTKDIGSYRTNNTLLLFNFREFKNGSIKLINNLFFICLTPHRPPLYGTLREWTLLSIGTTKTSTTTSSLACNYYMDVNMTVNSI